MNRRKLLLLAYTWVRMKEDVGEPIQIGISSSPIEEKFLSRLIPHQSESLDSDT